MPEKWVRIARLCRAILILAQLLYQPAESFIGLQKVRSAESAARSRKQSSSRKCSRCREC